jgi:hypothetical protein
LKKHRHIREVAMKKTERMERGVWYAIEAYEARRGGKGRKGGDGGRSKLKRMNKTSICPTPLGYQSDGKGVAKIPANMKERRGTRERMDADGEQGPGEEVGRESGGNKTSKGRR